MTQRRRQYQEEFWLLLTMLGCATATLTFAIVVALAMPIVIIPAVAQSIPTATRIPIVPSNTPSSTPSATPPPTVTGTPTILTPTRTPTSTPTEIALSGVQDVAVYSKTNAVWVTNHLGNSVAELDPRATNFALSILRDIPSPGDIAIWQARGLAYVTNSTQNTVTELDLDAHRTLGAIKVGAAPFGIAVDQETGDVYVPNSRGFSISVISSKTREVREIPWKAGPSRLAWLGRSGTFFVINQDGTGQTLTPNGAGEPIKFDFGLNRLTARFSSPSLGLVGRFQPIVVYVTSSRGIYGQSSQQQFLALKSSPKAIADLGRCIGVVLPLENSLVTIDYRLNVVIGTHDIGAQGLDGGDGLDYNPVLDTAYVANHAANSVSAITQPCPLYTPTPTATRGFIIPIIPIQPFFPFVTDTPTRVPLQ